MARLDHLAYRVPNRKEAVQFYIDAFGYKVQQEFEVVFDDGTKAMCTAMEPPEKGWGAPWTLEYQANWGAGIDRTLEASSTLHLPPEIFISEGEPGSVVDKWVQNRIKNGGGFLHHLAYQVVDVRGTMNAWQKRGWAEFTTKDILTCPDDELHQVFTKPNKYTGVIIEFIKRGEHGFCNKNVKDLMVSTKDLK